MLFLTQQVFADGREQVKNPVDGMFDNPTKENTVRRNHSLYAYVWQ